MNLKIFLSVMALVSALVSPAYAEYVFKKDGAIIKGAIIRDETASLVIRTESGSTERIKREDIIRVLYTDLYIGKVYIRLNSGEVLEGYQVDEDRDNYVFRKDISSPLEFTLPRKKVMFIARTNPTDLVCEGGIDSVVVKWSPPFKPAKLYRLYIRENKKGEKFRVAGETDNTSYSLKKLARSASYEVYVTAIDDGNIESLPSEKILANTIPYPPEDLVMTELKSADEKTVTLVMKWKPVKDKESRVKSYIIYRTDDGGRNKLGAVTGGEFVIKDFPAEGKHYFTVVAVNDLGTESVDVTAVYDAGYRVYIRLTGAYFVPLGDMAVITGSGRGGLLDFTMGGKYFSAGFETGYMDFTGADEEIRSMAIIPLLAVAEYRLPLFYTFSLRPVVKAGGAYVMTEYTMHDIADPSITETIQKSGFNPMASGGLFIEMRIAGFIDVFAGAEYSAEFEKNSAMRFLNCCAGVSVVF